MLSLCGSILVGANLLVVSDASALRPSKTFPTCSELRKVYPRGVAFSSIKSQKQISKPKVSASVYLANEKLDVDNDGTVCEVAKPKKSPIVVTTIPSVSTSVETTIPWGLKFPITIPRITTPVRTTIPRITTPVRTTIPRITRPVVTTIPSVSTSVETSRSIANYFPAEALPFNGTVTGANLGPLGTSSFLPARSFEGKAMCEVQNVKSVNFDYRNGPVMPCSQSDFVILKYSGLIPKTNRGIQSVQIEANYDDGIYMLIDGVPVLNNWSDCVCSSSLIIPNLDLNVDHSFELWYYENRGEAFFNVKWQSISTTSTTRSITTISKAPITTISAAPITTTTTTCAPNQSAINTLNERVGPWKLSTNRSNTVALLRYNGSEFVVWSMVFDSNQAIFSRALVALNSCKQIGYVFDDWNFILNRANKTRNLRLSDSVAYLVGA